MNILPLPVDESVTSAIPLSPSDTATYYHSKVLICQDMHMAVFTQCTFYIQCCVNFKANMNYMLSIFLCLCALLLIDICHNSYIHSLFTSLYKVYCPYI